MPTSSSTKAMHHLGGDSSVRVGREYRPKPEVSYATAKDIEEFYGRPQQGTMNALVAKLANNVVGVLGVVAEHGYGKYFCDFKDELKPHLRSITIMRGIKASLKFCDDYRGPVISVAEHAEGCRILHRLGFEHLQGAYYGWLK